MLNPGEIIPNYLDQYMHFSTTRTCDQQTDRNTTVTVGCGIAMWPNNRRTLTVEWMQQ